MNKFDIAAVTLEARVLDLVNSRRVNDAVLACHPHLDFHCQVAALIVQVQTSEQLENSALPVL